MWKQIVVAAALGLSLLACAGGGVPAALEKEQAKEPGAVDGVIEAYESIRLRLANDATEGLPAAFERLETAAFGAADAVASSTVAGHLRELGAASGAFDGADLQSARATFAEVSSHLVSAIATKPSLAGGLSIFECPMAEDYPKWVQASGAKANPYMGKDMQSCGVESTWE
ncbi:MAG: DUF3347 domain-containing protein [Acidobacteria bacterium]|nr:DUF3347 domain-containing protein [Acidobacteriota bacterium]